jgi:hypothetical protein
VPRYALLSRPAPAGVYQLRPPVRRTAHDESPAG